jgi:hypothetical protein
MNCRVACLHPVKYMADMVSIDRKLIKWLRKKHKIGYRKSVAKLNSIRQVNSCPASFLSLNIILYNFPVKIRMPMAMNAIADRYFI